MSMILMAATLEGVATLLAVVTLEMFFFNFKN